MSIVRSPIEFPELIREGDHLVQFYKSDSYLVESITNYVAPSLMNGEAVLLIATKEHLRLIEKSLNELCMNCSFLKLTKQLVMLDAEEELQKIMVKGMPDKEKFNSRFSATLSELQNQYQSVKTYEEMANLLWSSGNLEATLEVEGLWDKLLKGEPFTLMCSYSMELLTDEKQGIVFSEICQCHSHVIPAEGIIESDDHREQLKKIAELQFNITSKDKTFNEWKVNTLEMMIPLTALKIHLRELKHHAEELDIKAIVMKCEHQLDRMAHITEKLSR